ncbi:hypothetical protein [Halostagnicola bangensis]
MTSANDRRNPETREAPFRVAYLGADIEKGLYSANEIVEFYRRYHRHTGDDVTVERARFGFELPVEGTLEQVISELDEQYERAGVPIGTIATAMGEQGWTVGETLERIYEVRMTGALYEPRADHLAVV